MSRPTRRTRIVCISDTHNTTVKLPKGDVLIHAGDLTNQGSYSEAVQWLEKADFEAKIVVAGNHDISLDHDFYSKHGSSFHNQNPEDPARCLALFTSSPTITYLQHSSATIRLTRPDGPGTEFTVFGSPYSPQWSKWAFMYRRSDSDPIAKDTLSGSASTAAAAAAAAAAALSPHAKDIWSAIPLATDILVTHTPPRTHCDDACGCEELRETLAKVRPRLHVCGHVHQARGAERVRWGPDLDTSGGGGGGGGGNGISAVAAAEAVSAEPWQDPSPDPASAKISLVDLTGRGGKRALDFCGGSGDAAGRDEGADSSSGVPGVGAQGMVDRTGRRETCVVNCAIVANGWPHIGGKRFNKPIVVDIDLPVWR